MKKGGKANDSKTAPKNLPADDKKPDPNDPAESGELKAGETEPGSNKNLPADDKTPDPNDPVEPGELKAGEVEDPFSGFKVKEKVIIPSLNNALGTIKQLTNHAGKPVAEVTLPNGKTDWFTLKEIAAVPADQVPQGGIPASDPSLSPAQPGVPAPQLSA